MERLGVGMRMGTGWGWDGDSPQNKSEKWMAKVLIGCKACGLAQMGDVETLELATTCEMKDMETLELTGLTEVKRIGDTEKSWRSTIKSLQDLGSNKKKVVPLAFGVQDCQFVSVPSQPFLDG